MTPMPLRRRGSRPRDKAVQPDSSSRPPRADQPSVWRQPEPGAKRGPPLSRQIVVRAAAGVQGEPVRGPLPRTEPSLRERLRRPWTPPTPRPSSLYRGRPEVVGVGANPEHTKQQGLPRPETHEHERARHAVPRHRLRGGRCRVGGRGSTHHFPCASPLYTEVISTRNA